MEVDLMFRIRLKELREQKEISQYKFADDLKLSQSTIGNWEAGKREPNFDTLIKIAQYFNVSVDYLLGITDSVWTANDYANGVTVTKHVNITADDEDMLDKYHEVEKLLGKKGKNLIIEFCDVLIEKFGE